MAPAKPKKYHEFNVKLDQTDRDMLSQLADDANTSQATVLRNSIKHHFRQRFANEPTCANGNRCLCPNMHSIRSDSKLTNAQIVEEQAITHAQKSP